MSVDPATLPYRPCAGLMIINGEGRIFVGRRIDQKVEAWQLPQGGIDDGEDATTAAWRELTEETGITSDHAELIAEAPGDYFYDLPPELIGRAWHGRYRGQRMRWFLFRFTGSDADIDLATHHQEFSAWRWADRHEVLALAVAFKRDLYAEVMAAFADHLSPA
ncbi:RNA pyrophosphohydrolase [Sphingomonas sp. GlSt437]|uniref:RNA pyrophosphohydrolase n=1 Tax=Sphingomonas sp. GlSt437 TaxID=3389970 RepID=UPI003A8A2607